MNSNTFKLLNEKNIEEGLIIELNSGEPCNSDESKAYNIRWELTCDNTLERGDLVVTDNSDLKDSDKCSFTIKAKTKSACPYLYFYAAYKFLQDNKIIASVIFIFIGILFSFFGYKLMRVTIFLLGVVSVTCFVFILVFQFILPSGGKPVLIWVVLGFGCALGILLGFAMSYYKKLFFSILGGVFGMIIANLSYIIILRYIDSNPDVVYWLTLVACIALFAFLTVIFHKYLVIIATSVIGSYSIMRGISIFFGNYPNESYIIDCIKSGEEEELKKLVKPAFIAYIVFFVLCSIGTIYFQIKINTEDKEEDNKSENMMSTSSKKKVKTINSIWDNLKES